MTAPGVPPKQFICVDPGTCWGMFFEGAFKSLLKHGYLDEGSLWLQKNTGIIHEVIGISVPSWLAEDLPWKQEPEPPIPDCQEMIIDDSI